MTTALFAYGTLQIPQVLAAVTGRVFPSRPARLPDYARYCLRGRSYPGISDQPGATTPGLLYLGIDARSLRRIDEFEDEFYCRQSLVVLTASDQEIVAEVYVVRESHYDMMTSSQWDLGVFKERSLSHFLDRCR